MMLSASLAHHCDPESLIGSIFGYILVELLIFEKLFSGMSRREKLLCNSIIYQLT